LNPKFQSMYSTFFPAWSNICILLFVWVLPPLFSLGTNKNLDQNHSKIVEGHTPTKNKSEKKEKSPETVSPKLKHLKIRQSLSGFIEDISSVSLSVNSAYWNELKVIESPVHGKKVRQGEVILEVDQQKIKEKIEVLSHELYMLDADRKILQVEIELAEKLLPLTLSELKRNEKYIKEDLKRFQTIDLPFEKKTEEMKLKRYQDYLQYSMEELNQLKQMYQDDDLTEETEEIILQRAENDVQYMKFYVESAKKNLEEFNQIKKPRSEVDMRDVVSREHIRLQAQRKTKPAKLKIQRLQLTQIDEKRKLIVQKRSNLQNDLKQMTVKSPLTGVLYWGTFSRGKWSGTEPFRNKLQKGGKLKAHEPVLTICPGKKLRASINIPEKHLSSFLKTKTGQIILESNPEHKLSANVHKIGPTADSPGMYTGYLNFSLPKGIALPNPGTSCTFTYMSYEKKKALLLPNSVIFTENHDPDIQYVYILTKSGKSKKKVIEIGQATSQVSEVIKGIMCRNKVLKEKPIP
jgi:HlyD family secretion protein